MQLATAPEYSKPLIVKILLTAIVVACTGALAFSRQFYTEALADAFFGLALGSIVILHLRICRKYLDLLPLAGGTILIGFVDFRILHYGPRIMAWFSFLGISSLLIMVVRTIWAPQRKMLLYTWVPSALFVASDYFASTMLAWTSAAHPKTLDVYLLSFDGSMGVPAVLCGRPGVRTEFLVTLGKLACIYRIGRADRGGLLRQTAAFQGESVAGDAGVSRSRDRWASCFTTCFRPAALRISFQAFRSARF